MSQVRYRNLVGHIYVVDQQSHHHGDIRVGRTTEVRAIKFGRFPEEQIRRGGVRPWRK